MLEIFRAGLPESPRLDFRMFVLSGFVPSIGTTVQLFDRTLLPYIVSDKNTANLVLSQDYLNSHRGSVERTRALA